MGDIIKRHGGYTIRWYEGGRRRTLASKQASYAEARRMLLEIEARVARGEVGIVELRQSWPTLAELVERFLSEYSGPRIKDLTRYRTHAWIALQRALPTLGDRLVDQVQVQAVAKLRDTLRTQYKPASVAVTLAFLGTMFSWAIREGLAPHNPCKGVDKPAVAHSLDFLERSEVQRLLEASSTDHRLHAAIALAAYVGLRKGELLGLRWQDLDLETRRLTVARSYTTSPKSGKARHLRLPAALIPILRAWRGHCPQSPHGVVLPIRGTTGEKAMLGLPKLMAALGMRKVLHPWHLLRHTFASHFVMNGGNILALQKILGHSDLKMTMIYAHLAPDYLEREMDKVRY
jgi:integrase